MEMLEIIGWSSTFFFSVCGLPQAVKSWRERSAVGVSWAFLVMWILGEILATIYTCFQAKLLWPLIVNYLFNIVLISVVLYWKFYGEKNGKVGAGTE